jgi:putative sterol carrier protein
LAIRDRLRHAWNAFRFTEENPQTIATSSSLGPSSSHRPDRPWFRYAGEKTIISAIYTRLGIDIAAVPIRHVRLDENRQYQEDMDSGLNECLTVEANIDQGAMQFRQDMAQTLFDEGVIAILPVDTSLNPLVTGGYDITSMRVGKIATWYPKHVMVRAYNEDRGIQQDILMPKSLVAIVENPLYSVMNEPNSTLQRLIRKLNLLDVVDEQSASGKLDIIIQLPYVIKTEARREQANTRLKEIEFQLKGSQHGIAYTDGTEKIVQLNRPAENNLMGQIEFLTKMLYGELGLTEEVMNGTADEATMINYYNRSVKPVLTAIVEAMTRTFLTKTARSQGQAVKYFRNPFELVPIKDLAEITDKFTRNEVLSSNEMRSIIGWRPSKDPKADKLQNKNIPETAQNVQANGSPAPPPVSSNGSQVAQSDAQSIVDGSLDQVDLALDEAFNSLGISG